MYIDRSHKWMLVADLLGCHKEPPGRAMHVQLARSQRAARPIFGAVLLPHFVGVLQVEAIGKPLIFKADATMPRVSDVMLKHIGKNRGERRVIL
jgi:hypothetical protein